MNILDVGDLALSALPQEAVRRRMPQLDPNLLAEEQIEAGTRYFFVMNRGSKLLYRFPPEEWQLLKLFDGRRSYAEIAEEYARLTGIEYTAGQVKEYAGARLETGEELFYKTAAEKHMARLRAVTHHHHRKKRKLDLAEIRLLWFDPHGYLSWAYRKLRFIFTPGFTLATLILWAWMTQAWITHWSAIWNDSLRYYSFADMSAWDLAEYWLLFLVVAVIHETAHGLAVYNWNGESHAMGFMLMWMTPAFFCDCAEVYVYGGKWARIAVSVAGMWSELLLCVLATAVWLATAPGMFIHELAYKLILVGGILLILLNLNPLIKLDGYYIFTDLIGFPDLKEDSTAYLSNLIRKLFGLPQPHPMPALRTRRKIFYFVYAVLSGIYSYLLLTFFATLGYHVALRFWPQWAWFPAMLIALLLFKSRLVRLVEFMRTLYLDKKERLRTWLTPWRALPLGALALLLLFAPLWRDTVRESFILEAPMRAVLRAQVPGRVLSISAREGEQVAAGQTLVRLGDLALESEAARAQAGYELASARALNAQLRYADLGATRNELIRSEQQRRELADRVGKLSVVSPIAGVVVTPRPQDLVGSYLQAGSTILEVAQTSTLRARVFIPEAFLHELQVGAPVSLNFAGMMSPLHSGISVITAAPVPVPQALMDNSRYKGLGAPALYAAWVDVPNPGTLHEGMRGEAKILVAHRSLAGLAWRALADSLGRRIW